MTLPPTIVFDLDGTLVDSLEDIFLSFQHSFTVYSLPVPEARAIKDEICKPLEDMFAVFAPAHVEALSRAYRSHYPEHFTDHSSLYPGVRELLKELRRRGYRSAVATTKRSDMARLLAAAVGLDKLVDHLQGTDDIPHKPAPDVVYQAVAGAGGEGLWMVGDTVMDILAGKAAGLRTYAVTWGTHDEVLLKSARPDILAPDLGRLLESLPPLD
ncbi:HAD family hydrolase [soil metagenome]